MTKIDALMDLFKEADASRRSMAAAKRIKRAADVLGLSDDERWLLFKRCEYIRNDHHWFDGPKVITAAGFTYEDTWARQRFDAELRRATKQGGH